MKMIEDKADARMRLTRAASRSAVHPRHCTSRQDQCEVGCRICLRARRPTAALTNGDERPPATLQSSRLAGDHPRSGLLACAARGSTENDPRPGGSNEPLLSNVAPFRPQPDAKRHRGPQEDDVQSAWWASTGIGQVVGRARDGHLSRSRATPAVTATIGMPTDARDAADLLDRMIAVHSRHQIPQDQGRCRIASRGLECRRGRCRSRYLDAVRPEDAVIA